MQPSPRYNPSKYTYAACWCWWRDSNPHCTGFKPVASSVWATPAKCRIQYRIVPRGIPLRRARLLALFPAHHSLRISKRSCSGRTMKRREHHAFANVMCNRRYTSDARSEIPELVVDLADALLPRFLFRERLHLALALGLLLLLHALVR